MSLHKRCALVLVWSLAACAQRGAEAPPRPFDASHIAAPDGRAGNNSNTQRRAAATQSADADNEPEAAAAERNATAAKAASHGAKPTTAPTDASSAAGDEHCKQRRVSYSRPCHDDPDPCRIESGWAGDEYCWAAPAKGKGVQIHIGPSSYTDPDEVAKYIIEPGQEHNDSVLAHVPLEADHFYERTMVRMRPGSHHWLASVVEGQPPERFYGEGDQNCGSSSVVSPFSGGQTLIYDNPPGGIPAPENEGLGAKLKGGSSLCVNMHAYNFTDKAQLREMWINVYFIDAARVTQQTEAIGIVGGMQLSVPPGAHRTLSFSRTFTASGRIVQLFGHRHVWTPRFAAWLNDELIYDSWSWQESTVFNYDSLTDNPPPMSAQKLDGAASGPVTVRAGDELRFSCFIENESDTTLTWHNELRGGEMCNLWGSTVGRGTGLSAQLP